MGGGKGGSGFGNTQGSRLNSEIHQGKQDKHIEGSNNYNQQVQNGKNPSILTENPNDLLREGIGKGNNHGSVKETVDYGRVIGKFYYPKTGKYYDTSRATIHYDSNGKAHIVPSMPNYMMELLKKER